MRKVAMTLMLVLALASLPMVATAQVGGDTSGSAATNNVNVNVSNSAGGGPTASGVGSNDIDYGGEYTVKSVPSMAAPALTTTLTETCMGSTSAAGAVVGFGISFGTTWRDTACVRRLDARQLQALGYNLGAKELMCDSEAVRAALKRAGKPCYNDLPDEMKRPEDRADQQEPTPTAAAGGRSGGQPVVGAGAAATW